MRPETLASEPFEYRPWWPGSQIDLLAGTESAMQLGKSAKNTRVPLTCAAHVCRWVVKNGVLVRDERDERDEDVDGVESTGAAQGGSNRAVPNRLSLITSNLVDSGLLVQVEFG